MQTNPTENLAESVPEPERSYAFSPRLSFWTIRGTLQWAGVHLRTPLFVVMGHEGCGAVEAAITARFHRAQHSNCISVLLENIPPALDGLDATLLPEALLSAAVEANVRWSMRALLESPEGMARVTEGVMQLVGAVFEIPTGRVRFLE